MYPDFNLLLIQLKAFQQNLKNFMFKVLNLLFKGVNLLLKYPFIILIVLAVFAVAAVALCFYNKTNVGGLIGKVMEMLGLAKSNSLVEKANSVPQDRKQAIGEADANGYVQHKVDELKISDNPFRDKTILNLPDGQKIKLPEGIQDTDVDTVIRTQVDIKVIPKEGNIKQANDTKAVIEEAKVTTQSAKELLAKLKARK